MAILHMTAALKPNVHVFVLDTDYLFEETHQTRERATAALNLTNVQIYKPNLTHEEQAAEYGAALWMRNPDLCCDIRKVEPNRRARSPARPPGSPASAVTSPRGRSDVSHRRLEPEVRPYQDQPACPLDREGHLELHQPKTTFPTTPLLDHGFVSIGCFNCTVPGKQGRQGRWEGFDKDECGLHT